ncbi:hypothetical protein GIY62_23210 [Burkholderia plantarii]|uniref:hypothetical protein n=1 Tax=Burkholderia plantarii TaxID=41899 RepID=UPI00272A5F1E|nr:hypothetical protein [Burkholderia plantarii]WLE63233.1 hypothetical protein GIY62_23210 [Burkholderia plantarii]
MKKAWLVPFVVVLTSGCASDTWIYPVFNASDQRALVKDGAQSAAVPLTVDDSRNLVIGLTQKLDSASRHRDDGKLVLRELLFYGTLLAAGGVAAGSIAVRNIGGVIAGGSVTLDSHYQPSVQSKAFANAAMMMRCAQDRLDPIDPALVDVLGQSLTSHFTPEARSAYADIPRQVRDYIQRVSLNLQAELAAVQLAKPSQQDIQSALDQAGVAEKAALRATENLADTVTEAVKNGKLTSAAFDINEAAKFVKEVKENAGELAAIPVLQSAPETTGPLQKLTVSADAAVAAASSAVAKTGELSRDSCQFNNHSLADVKASDLQLSDMRRYRGCLIREKTAAEQGEMAVTFVDATTKLSSGLDLCAKSIH